MREIVQLHAAGDDVRVRLTNTFGTAPLRVGAASVALSGGGASVVAGTTRSLRFAGRPDVLIPAGAEALSDPIALRVRDLGSLDLSIYLPGTTGPATQHPTAQQINYLAAGDQTSSSTTAGFRSTITCSVFAGGVDVVATPRVAGTVVTLGDSITDGFHSTIGSDHRYPDYLAQRLSERAGTTLSVSNAGISGNELLTYRTDVPYGAVFGPPAGARLQRDVLSQPGIREVILLEGINDIGADKATASALIQADQQIIAQARAAGLKIYGATLTPFGSSHRYYGSAYGSVAGDRQRRLLNAWIRTSGAFDAIFDFDRTLRDPTNPTQLLPAFDSGDHLHPNDAGYRAMADTVNLATLAHDACR